MGVGTSPNSNQLNWEKFHFCTLVSKRFPVVSKKMSNLKKKVSCWFGIHTYTAFQHFECLNFFPSFDNERNKAVNFSLFYVIICTVFPDCFSHTSSSCRVITWFWDPGLCLSILWYFQQQFFLRFLDIVSLPGESFNTLLLAPNW